MARIVKKDNYTRVVATPKQRFLASELTAANQRKDEAEREAKIIREEFLKETGGAVDVVLVNQKGLEVGTVALVEATGAIDWTKLRKEHPELDDLIESYRKPDPEPTIRVTVKWFEARVTQATRDAFRSLLGR